MKEGDVVLSPFPQADGRVKETLNKAKVSNFSFGGVKMVDRRQRFMSGGLG